MTITSELYTAASIRLPQAGKHIIGHQQEDLIVVYQAYNHAIADHAVANQSLGGDSFNYSRMSWIKPNFLWMMYRCGWAEKENQERVLALWICKKDLEKILAAAVMSSFNSKIYDSASQWKAELKSKDVRLQWDPDHDPFGRKLERRAIQLGLKGEVLEEFGLRQIKKVEDVTDFVKLQKKRLTADLTNQLYVPIETVFKISDPVLNEKIGITMDEQNN